MAALRHAAPGVISGTVSRPRAAESTVRVSMFERTAMIVVFSGTQTP